jgi:hypothetical protein
MDRIDFHDIKRLTVEIYFLVDGKDYARRTWPCVPPIGSRVMMHPQEGAEVYEVTQVTYGVNRDDTDMLTCNVAIARVSKAKPRAKAKAAKEST